MADMFFVKIAELNIQISPIYSLSEKLCKDYITEPCENPDISVTVSEDKLKAESEKAQEPAPIEYTEFLYIYRVIAEKLPEFCAFVFHGAAISYKEQGYLFTAPSGTGKSTHICLWRKYIGKSVDIINGDKPIIKITDSGVLICSTPWAGKEGWQKNRILPLSCVTFLERSTEPFILKMNAQDSINRIMNQIYMPKNAQNLGHTLENIDRLLSKVPIYRLGCDISENSVKVAFESLTKEEYKKTGA